MWKKTLKKLNKRMTQAEIAKACKTSQATISRLLSGARRNPSYELGERIIRLGLLSDSGDVMVGKQAKPEGSGEIFPTIKETAA